MIDDTHTNNINDINNINVLLLLLLLLLREDLKFLRYVCIAY